MKFEIRKSEEEIAYKDRKKIKEGITQVYSNDRFYEVVEVHFDKVEALEALRKYKSGYKELSNARTYYLVKEYYVEMVGLDKYGYDQDLGVLEYSKLEFKED
nr:MAG TPA: hypothetical protein [Caudoviricetes sp.]